jgi:hypothetical protein
MHRVLAQSIRSMRSHLGWIPLAIGLVVPAVLGRAAARADDRPLADAITVARASDCLEHGALLEHVRTWLRSDRVDARLAIVVHEEEVGASFVITRDGAPVAVRRFDRLPHGCPDRRAALGLAVALALDAAVLDALEAAAPPADSPVAVEEERGDASTDVALELALEAQALFEVLPEVAAGWQLGARVVVGDSFEVGAHAWLTSVAGADLSAGRVSVQLSGGRLDLCARRRVDSIALRGCAGVAAGAAFGTGLDLPGARATVVGFAGLLGRVAVSIPLTDWLALELAGDGWLSLWRPRFDVVDPNGVPVASAELPAGGAVASVGFSTRF